MSEQQEYLGFLNGDRVTITAPEPNRDLPAYLEMMNDWPISKGLTIIPPISETDERNWFNQLEERKDTDKLFAILLKASGETIGSIGLHQIHWINRTASTGTVLRRRFHKYGYGREAKKLLLWYAFNVLNLRKIKAQVYDFNHASIESLQECGYQPDGGPHISEVFRDGRYHDVYHYTVFRDDFEKTCADFLKQYPEFH